MNFKPSLSVQVITRMGHPLDGRRETPRRKSSCVAQCEWGYRRDTAYRDNILLGEQEGPAKPCNDLLNTGMQRLRAKLRAESEARSCLRPVAKQQWGSCLEQCWGLPLS